jgi:hypothetical protein
MLRAKLGAFMSYYLPTIRFKQLPFFTDIHGLVLTSHAAFLLPSLT